MRHFRMPRGGDDPSATRSKRQAIRKARRLAISKQGDERLKRESFVLPAEKATNKAFEMLRRFPRHSHWTKVESWKQTADGKIAFTLCRLETAG